MANFATLDDVKTIWRELSSEEEVRVEALLPLVSDALRAEADKVGKDLDSMIIEKPFLASVAKAVTVDIISRMVASPTDEQPLSQFSQSALGYTVSGTYLSPGGGLYIKNSELARLGLKRQKIGVIEFYYED